MSFDIIKTINEKLYPKEPTKEPKIKVLGRISNSGVTQYEVSKNGIKKEEN